LEHTGHIRCLCCDAARAIILGGNPCQKEYEHPATGPAGAQITPQTKECRALGNQFESFGGRNRGIVPCCWKAKVCEPYQSLIVGGFQYSFPAWRWWLCLAHTRERARQRVGMVFWIPFLWARTAAKEHFSFTGGTYGAVVAELELCASTIITLDRQAQKHKKTFVKLVSGWQRVIWEKPKGCSCSGCGATEVDAFRVIA